MKRATIGIIGGTGNMGRWFEDLFFQAGYRVLIAGRKTELSYTDLAKESDVIILSTPLDSALKICRQIGPILKQDQLLMDLCSLKESICSCMLESTSAQVIGSHPLFGPFTDSIKGQNVIICPCRGTSRLIWLENEFKSKGAVITRMDPLKHDRTMAVVQGLTHFLTVCMGKTLQKMDMPPDEAIFYSTPIFRINIDLIGRLFAQDHNLFKALINNNKYVKEALDSFTSAMDETINHLFSGDNQDGSHFLEKIKEFVGDFCETGLNESNEIINSIYSNNSCSRFKT